MTKSYHCVVSGKVQGVFFRSWIHDQAVQLGVTGWVRNVAEGKVEVLAQGEADTLEKLKNVIRQGSTLTQTTEVHCEWIDYEKAYDHFEIRG